MHGMAGGAQSGVEKARCRVLQSFSSRTRWMLSLVSPRDVGATRTIV